MLFPLLLLSSGALGSVYDSTPGYQIGGFGEQVPANTKLECLTSCDENVACLAVLVDTYNGPGYTGPFRCYSFAQLVQPTVYYGPINYFFGFTKRAVDTIPNPDLPSGALVCTSATCFSCPFPSYLDSNGACQPACDASQGCSLNSAGNGCLCIASPVTETDIQVSTIYQTLSITPTNTITQTSLAYSTSTFVTQTIEFEPATSMPTAVSSTITEIATTTLATVVSTATISQFPGISSCVVYQLQFPAACCPTLPTSSNGPARRFGKRATVFVGPTVTISPIVLSTSTILETEAASTETDTATVTIEVDSTSIQTSSSTLAPSTPTVTSTLTYYSIVDAPTATSTITVYTQPTACVTSTIVIQTACPRPSAIQRARKRNIAQISNYQSTSGNSVIIDCGSAGMTTH